MRKRSVEIEHVHGSQIPHNIVYEKLNLLDRISYGKIHILNNNNKTGENNYFLSELC